MEEIPMIVIHGTKNCQQCKTTQKWLTSKGIHFTYKDLDEHPTLLQEFKSRGFSSLPVVIVTDEDGKELESFAGFYMGRIMKLEKYAS